MWDLIVSLYEELKTVIYIYSASLMERGGEIILFLIQFGLLFQ